MNNTGHYKYKGVIYNNRLELKEAIGNNISTKEFGRMITFGAIEIVNQ